MKKGLSFKLLLLVALALAVTLATALTTLFQGAETFSRSQMAEQRGQMLVEEQADLRDMVQLAYATVESYHQRSQDIESLKAYKARELQGIIEAVTSQVEHFIEQHKDVLTSEEMESEIKSLVRGIRFEGDNYVWINDLEPRMVMHPIRSDMDGRDLSTYADPQGTRLFVRMAEVARSEGEGIVEYMWAKPGETEDKLKVSYVKLVPGLGWIFGAGSWVEDIADAMKAEALAQVARLRLGDGNYFWVNDLEPRMIMHPTTPDLNGKPLADYTDTQGKRLFVEMAGKARAAGEGFVEYHWSKPGQPGDFPKLSYVRFFEPWGWVIGMGVYIDDIDVVLADRHAEFSAALAGMMRQAGLVSLIGLAVALAAVVWYFRRSLTMPLTSLVSFASRVAEGDLEAAPKGRFRDEMAVLKDSVERMVTSLKASLKEADDKKRQADMEAERARASMREAEEARSRAENARREGMLEAAGMLQELVEDLANSARELASVTTVASQGAQRQNERAAETATAMEEMNATVLEVARNASSAAEKAGLARDKAVLGRSVVADAVGAIAKVETQAVDLTVIMEDLGQQAEGIGRIITVIEDIADQTNLLALNAAIEAARAGDAGRGFAVVADEVRKLAETTMTATKEVVSAIQSIQGGTRKSLSAVRDASEAVATSTSLAEDSGKALVEIVALVEDSADRVRSIATASEEQSAASDEINRAVDDISHISAETATGMGQAERAVAGLRELAERLQKVIERMRS